MKTLKLQVLAVLLIALTVFSCQKSIEKTPDPLVSNVQAEAKAWFQSIKSSLSDTIQKLTTIKLEGLDYSVLRVLNLPSSETSYFFIKSAWQNEKYTEYLSFAKMNDRYETIGFVRVTKKSNTDELTNMEKFITKGELEPNFRLMVYNLYSKHVMTFEGLSNGGIKQLTVSKGQQRQNKEELKQLNLNDGTTGCTDWYMITTYTYPDGTQYQEEVYITTTCGDGSGCGAADPNGQNMECVNPGEGGGPRGSGDGNTALGRLCGNYQFANVGNSFTGTINNLSWTYRSPQGIEYPITYANTCLSIANYNVNQAQASAAFNEAFNAATIRVVYELNQGWLSPIGIQVRLKNLTQGYIANLIPGSTWSAIGACAGTIPVNTLNSSSYCL